MAKSMGHTVNRAYGVCTKEFVVIVVEKIIDETWPLDALTIQDTRIPSLFCVISGPLDERDEFMSKFTVDAVRGQASDFVIEKKPLDPEVIMKAASDLVKFAVRKAPRPLLTYSLLVAGIDLENRPCLYHMDLTGQYEKCRFKAIGLGNNEADQQISVVYNDSMTLRDAIKALLSILKQVMEEKLNDTNVEVATVMTNNQKFKRLGAQEIKEYIKDLP